MLNFHQRRFEKVYRQLLEAADPITTMADQLIFSLKRDLNDEMFGPAGEEEGDITSGYGPKPTPEKQPEPKTLGSRLSQLGKDVISTATDAYSSSRARSNMAARRARGTDLGGGAVEMTPGDRARHIRQAQEREKLASKDGDSWWDTLKKAGGRLFNTSRTYDGASLNEAVRNFLDEAATPEVVNKVIDQYRGTVMQMLQQAYEKGKEDVLANAPVAQQAKDPLEYDPAGGGVGYRKVKPSLLSGAGSGRPGRTPSETVAPEAAAHKVMAAIKAAGGDMKKARTAFKSEYKGMKGVDADAEFDAQLEKLKQMDPQFAAWLSGYADKAPSRKKVDTAAHAAHRGQAADFPDEGEFGARSLGRS